jgi:hypothetical protein
MPID